MNEKQLLLEAWKQAVAVQMHFNELAMKLRAFALTLVAALVTAESLVQPGVLARSRRRSSFGWPSTSWTVFGITRC